MSDLALRQAAQQVGISRSTLLRAIKSGLLSATRDATGGYRIDASELARVYPLDERKTLVTVQHGVAVGASGEADAAEWRVRAVSSEAALKEVRETLEAEKRHSDELKQQADHWRLQAERLLLAAPLVTPAPAPVTAPRRASWWWWSRPSKAAAG